jgi:ABC-type dipeptide/oligopeptide/nickel transport system permease component
VTASTARFLSRRLGLAIVFVVAVPLASIVLGRLVPGDAGTDLAFTGAGATSVAEARAIAGLDRPLPAQLAGWIAGLLRLDLGRSARFGRPVSGLVGERGGNTALLGGVAFLLALALGLPAGLLTAAYPGALLARAARLLSVVLVSCPPVIGTLALLWLAVSTGWLSVAPGSFGVPVIALALPLAATIERLYSRATTEALAAPDLSAARARGLSPARLLWRHAGRRSLGPVLGLSGVLLASLLSGSLAVEIVASWPGLGRLTYEALVGRDLFLVAGCALTGAAFIAGANLLADLLRLVVDPTLGEF